MPSVLDRNFLKRRIILLSMNVTLVKGIAIVTSLIFIYQAFLLYFRLPLQCSCSLCSSGMLRFVGKLFCPALKPVKDEDVKTSF